MVKSTVRGGARLRELVSKANRARSSKYVCPKCQKKRVKRISNSVWECRGCGVRIAGAAYSLSTEAGSQAKKLLAEKPR